MTLSGFCGEPLSLLFYVRRTTGLAPTNFAKLFKRCYYPFLERETKTSCELNHIWLSNCHPSSETYFSVLRFLRNERTIKQWTSQFYQYLNKSLDGILTENTPRHPSRISTDIIFKPKPFSICFNLFVMHCLHFQLTYFISGRFSTVWCCCCRWDCDRMLDAFLNAFVVAAKQQSQRQQRHVLMWSFNGCMWRHVRVCTCVCVCVYAYVHLCVCMLKRERECRLRDPVNGVSVWQFK